MECEEVEKWDKKTVKCIELSYFTSNIYISDFFLQELALWGYGKKQRCHNLYRSIKRGLCNTKIKIEDNNKNNNIAESRPFEQKQPGLDWLKGSPTPGYKATLVTITNREGCTYNNYIGCLIYLVRSSYLKCTAELIRSTYWRIVVNSAVKLLHSSCDYNTCTHHGFIIQGMCLCIFLVFKYWMSLGCYFR